MDELDAAKEKLKAYVLQYILVSKLVIKHKPTIDKEFKTVEEQIKCEKLEKAFNHSVIELMDQFEQYFELERKHNAPITLTFRGHYKKLKDYRDKIL